MPAKVCKNVEVQNQVKSGGKIYFYFVTLLFGNTEDKKWRWLKVQHWINLSAVTELLSVLKYLSKIWLF